MAAAGLLGTCFSIHKQAVCGASNDAPFPRTVCIHLLQEDGATVEIEDEDTPQPLSPAQASTHASASLVEETLASSRQPPAAGTPATSAELPEQRLSASGSVVQPQPAVASSTAAGTAASVQPLVQHVGEREEMLMDASDLLSSLIDEEALVAAEQPSASGFTPTALAGAARGPASASAASSRSYTADFGDSREVSLQSAHATHAQPVAQQPPASHSLAEAEVSSVSGDIEVEEELEAEMASPLSSSASHPVAGGVKEDSQPAVQPQAALSVQSAPVEVATQPASTAGPAGTASSRGSSSSAELEAYESSQGGSQPPGGCIGGWGVEGWHYCCWAAATTNEGGANHFTGQPRLPSQVHDPCTAGIVRLHGMLGMPRSELGSSNPCAGHSRVTLLLYAGAGGEGSDDDLEGVQAAFNLTAGMSGNLGQAALPLNCPMSSTGVPSTWPQSAHDLLMSTPQAHNLQSTSTPVLPCSWLALFGSHVHIVHHYCLV
jgi:hypothetical protein